MIKLVPRAQASAKWGYLSPILAVFLTLIASSILFMALGKDPVEALYTFFISPIANWYGVTELLVVAIPILLCAYGLALCYRASIWNIGAEGQLLTGAVVGTVMALQFVDSSSAWAMPLTLIAGMVGGMICSGISAFLNLRLNCNETLVTIMMNYIALNTLLWAVYGPLKDPNGYNFPESALFGDSTLLPILFEGTRLHVGLLLVVLALVVTWVFMSCCAHGRLQTEKISSNGIFSIRCIGGFSRCRYRDWLNRAINTCHFARLRLLSNYCCLSWAFTPRGNNLSRIVNCTTVYGWRNVANDLEFTKVNKWNITRVDTVLLTLL